MRRGLPPEKMKAAHSDPGNSHLLIGGILLPSLQKLHDLSELALILISRPSQVDAAVCKNFSQYFRIVQLQFFFNAVG